MRRQLPWSQMAAAPAARARRGARRHVGPRAGAARPGVAMLGRRRLRRGRARGRPPGRDPRRGTGGALVSGPGLRERLAALPPLEAIPLVTVVMAVRDEARTSRARSTRCAPRTGRGAARDPGGRRRFRGRHRRAGAAHSPPRDPRVRLVANPRRSSRRGSTAAARRARGGDRARRRSLPGAGGLRAAPASRRSARGPPSARAARCARRRARRRARDRARR